MKPQAGSSRKQYLRFWGWWAALGFLLFLPNFLFYYQQATLWPSTTLEGGETLGPLRILFLRNNQDVFRLCGEWVVLSFLLWWGWRPGRTWRIAAWLGAGLYVLLLAYNTYWVFYQRIYGTHPHFADDYLLAREVLPVFLRGAGVGGWMQLVIGVGGLSVVLALAGWAFARWMRATARARPDRLMLGIWLFIGLFVAAGTWKYRKGTFPGIWQSVQWFAPRMVESLQPPATDSLAQGPFFKKLQANLLKPLPRKPDVFLVFVEAYGSTVVVSPYTRDSFRLFTDSLTRKLEREGIHTATIYSRSPVIGGRSWLAFTSAMTGLWLDSHLAYDRLLDYKGIYPHLVTFFSKHGYHTARISTMKATGEIDSLIPLERINGFFGFETWLRWGDIPYKGYPYNPFGGIPDQYSLEYCYEQVARPDPRPDFLFFITTNSHAPWYLPPPLPDDWRLLDTVRHSPNGAWWALPKGMMRRYRLAVEYQLGMLAAFAERHLDEEDLLIVVGDHQPPGIDHTYHIVDAHATPLHVFTRNRQLVQRLVQQGFLPGLNRGAHQAPLWRHDTLALWLESVLLGAPSVGAAADQESK